MGYKKSVHINAPIGLIWQLWTSSEGASQWLAPKANVDFRVGGAYEFFWDDDPQKNSTSGCVLLHIETEKLLQFEWQGRTDFLHLFLPPEGKRTMIEVRFRQQDAGTLVSIEQAETRNDADWLEYDVWMSKAWEMALTSLQKHCESPSAGTPEPA